jgi:hypothetical protein
VLTLPSVFFPEGKTKCRETEGEAAEKRQYLGRVLEHEYEFTRASQPW